MCNLGLAAQVLANKLRRPGTYLTNAKNEADSRFAVGKV